MNLILKKTGLLFILLPLAFHIANSQKNMQPYHMAVALFQKGELDQALNLFDQVIEDNRRDVSSWVYRGKIFSQKGDYVKAIHDFEEANKIRPDVASYQLAQAYAQINDLPNMIGHLEKHLKSRYKLPESAIRLDNAFSAVENTNEWVQFWKKDWYSRRERFVDEINYLNTNKKHFEALDEIDKAIKKNKKDHRLYALRAHTYSQINNHKAAVVNYNKAIGANRRNPDYFTGRGNAHLNAGNFRDAFKDFETAHKQEPDNLELFILKAGALNKMGKYHDATGQVILYLELMPDNLDALILCGDIFLNNKEYNQAIYYFTKALALDKSNPAFYLKRGNSYFEDKQYRKAFEDYSMSLDLDPRNPVLYMQRGNARLRIGDYSGACSDWQTAQDRGISDARKNILQFCR